MADGNFGPSAAHLEGPVGDPIDAGQPEQEVGVAGQHRLGRARVPEHRHLVDHRHEQLSGIAAVYVDGVKKKTVDLYSATTKHQQLVYRVPG